MWRLSHSVSVIGLILVFGLIPDALGQESSNQLDLNGQSVKKDLIDVPSEGNREVEATDKFKANAKKSGDDYDVEAKDSNSNKDSGNKASDFSDNQDAPKGDTQSNDDTPMSVTTQIEAKKANQATREESEASNEISANANPGDGETPGARVKKYARSRGEEEDEYEDKRRDKPIDDYDDKVVDAPAEIKTEDKAAEEKNPEVQFRAQGAPSKINERKSAYLSKGLKTELEGFNISRSLADVAECQQDIISIPGKNCQLSVDVK